MDMKALTKKVTLFIGLALVVALSASSSSAWWGGRHGFGHGYGHGYYGHYGWGWGYHHPYYWGLDFAVVAPPIGAVVAYLPDGYTTFVTNGVQYYYCSGYYFRACPSGYVIVNEPEVSATSAPEPSQAAKQASVAQPAPQAAGTTARAETEATAGGSAKAGSVGPSQPLKANSTADDGAITINIPNSKGGFTAVKLTRFKDGYKGPQGEFYPNHPTVEELKALYGGAQ